MNRLVQKTKLLLWQTVLLGGVSLLTVYFFYRATFINFSLPIVVFSIILFLAELHTIFHLYGMFYSLWPRNYKIYKSLYKNRDLKFNIFICVCGEPAEVVRQTVLGAKTAVALYKKTLNPKHTPQIIVLNDGRAAKKDNWKEIVALAKELKVGNITRIKPGGFKAGNINNALSKTPTKDPFNTLDIVLDADFKAKPEFLLEIAKPFKDQTVDFAQSPQRYKNEITWVAKASAAHQIFFFDHICQAKGHDNALFLCGTNFAIRRSALNEIGGMDTKYITEDYATSLELHLIGKKGVFIPNVIAEGMAPHTLKEYFSQQQRWSKGSMDVTLAYLGKILFGPMSLRQKFHYMLSATYYLIGLRDLILILAPLPYLFFGVSLIKTNTWQYLAFIYGPLIVYNFILYLRLFKHPLKSLVLDIASFPVFTAAVLSSITKRNLAFVVTIKKYERQNPFAVYRIQLIIAAILAVGLYVGFHRPLGQGGALLNYFWACFDVFFLMVGFYLIAKENYESPTFKSVLSGIKQTSINILKAPALSLKSIVILLPLFIAFYLLLQTPAVSKSLVSLAQFTEPSATPILALPSVEPLAPSTKELLIPDEGVYYGYYQPSLDTHPIKPATESVNGEKTSLVMFYQDWSGDQFDTKFVSRLSDNNQRIPIITWEPWDSSLKLSPKNLKEYSLESIIAGNHDESIRSWAKGAAAYKQPVFLRFAHEMNGDWYPWGNSNEPKTYIKMWRHVHDIFEEEGATNVIWIWSPNNTDQLGSTNNLLDFYPGDNYVDWVGFSGFNWGTTNKSTKWTSFKDLAIGTYDQLKTINKPIIVSETSSVSQGGNKQEWFEQLLTNDLPQFPRIKAVIFFDQNIQKANFNLKSGANFQEVAQDAIVNNPYFISTPLIKH